MAHLNRIRASATAVCLLFMVVGAFYGWKILGTTSRSQLAGHQPLKERALEDPESLLENRKKKTDALLDILQKVQSKTDILGANTDDLLDLIKYKKIAESGIRFEKFLGNKKSKWLETAHALQGMNFASESRVECGKVVQNEIMHRCRYDIEMAIQRTGPRTGKILFSKSKPVNPKKFPLCAGFSECVARGRVGHEVPLPEGKGQEIIGLRQHLFSSPTPGHLRTPKGLKDTIERLERTLIEDLATGDNDLSNHERYKIEDTRRFIEYMKRKLANMQGGAAGNASTSSMVDPKSSIDELAGVEPK